MGGSAKTNAHIIQQILKGHEHSSRTDIVALNAAAGLIVGKKAKNFKEGLALAQEIIHSGKAYQKLQAFVSATQKFK